MPSYTLSVNNRSHTVEVQPGTPLLWVLRDAIGLTGTKYSCGEGLCGACTVLVDKKPVKSCSVPIDTMTNREIMTIEGFSAEPDHPVRRAWVEEEAPQCGYCHPGQILTAAALLAENKNPNDGEIDDAMNGALCRCGTYQRIRRAIHRTAKEVDGR
jgi:aerobic-type carbon monoxide dehydrogenase small subunit (CoxS/CutS family)